MTVATRDIIQDGIADPKNQQAVVKAFVLSHGTMEVYNLKESRKFYEEFLGLECVRHAKPAMVVRCGLKFHIVAVATAPVPAFASCARRASASATARRLPRSVIATFSMRPPLRFSRPLRAARPNRSSRTMSVTTPM